MMKGVALTCLELETRRPNCIEKPSGPAILSQIMNLIGLRVVVQGGSHLTFLLAWFLRHFIFNVQILGDNEKHKTVYHFYQLDHGLFCHNNVLQTPTYFYRADVERPLGPRITDCMFDESS
jgi:hypothetical protein